MQMVSTYFISYFTFASDTELKQLEGGKKPLLQKGKLLRI